MSGHLSIRHRRSSSVLNHAMHLAVHLRRSMSGEPEDGCKRYGPRANESVRNQCRFSHRLKLHRLPHGRGSVTLEQLRTSTATWKIWGNTAGTLDMRADPQNLPEGLTKPWPGAGYATFAMGDPSSAYMERGEIYDFVLDHGVTGFATVAGDRHSFWAGLAAKSLPPKSFQPIGIAFITGSISRLAWWKRLSTIFQRSIRSGVFSLARVRRTAVHSRP
jgi:PhoD-like phosphatase